MARAPATGGARTGHTHGILFGISSKILRSGAVERHPAGGAQTKLERLSDDLEGFDVVDFIVFLVLFLGGFVLFGISHELPTGQAYAFTAGILLVSLAMAYVMRQRGSATKRADNWNQNQQ
ncbi:hypothetical protein ACLD0U_04770 [Microbacterium sp. 2216-1]